MNNDEIKQRCLRLESERKVQESLWQEIERYICPYRGEFMQSNQSESGIMVERPEIFDGTAMQAQQSLAANLHGNLTSPFFRWFHMKFRDQALNDNTEARAWLEDVAEVMWQALQESDFSLEIAEIYADLTTFATAALVEEQTGDRLDFTAIPLKEVYFEEDSKGNPFYFFRILNWTPLQIFEKFGENGTPDVVKIKAKTPTASAERMRVIFCVYPRGGAKAPVSYKKLPPLRRPWGFKYILEQDATLLGKEGGYHEMPVAVVRWNKISESRWGHGPSHIAVYDAKTLNRQEELMLQALAKIVDPPMKSTERGLIGDLDMSPGGLTIVKNADSLSPLQEKIDYQVVVGEREQRRNMIREYYFTSRLDLKESPAMTATEVERRWQTMQKLLGPTLGRLQAELLDPIIKITFGTLYRKKKLPTMPDSLQNSDAALDIEYIGPIPLAQKQDLAAAIERELAFATSLVEVYGPDATDAIDAQKAVREHAYFSGVPAKIIRSEAEMNKRKKERDAKAADAERTAKAGAGAEISATMAGAAKDAADAGMMPEDMMQGGMPPNAVEGEQPPEAAPMPVQ